MKNIVMLVMIANSILFASCDTGLIVSPNNATIDTTWYTIEGKYINGSTNKPYRNIELTLKLENYGYPRVLEEVAGPIRTDNNGYFKFRYQHIDRLKGIVFLQVYPTDLYPNIDSIPLNENVNQTVYQSTFGSLILNINPVSGNELFVYAGTQDTLHYKNINNSISDTIRFIPYTTTLVAWGKTKQELLDALKGKNSNQQYVKLSGDPFFNKFYIEF